MRIHEKTGCKIFLLGLLEEVPDLKMDANGDFFSIIKISRKNYSHEKFTHFLKKESIYFVFVNDQIALRIKQFGFKGLHLWIEGDFLNSGKIIAEKVSFLDFSNPNEEKNMLFLKSGNIFSIEENFSFHIIENKNELSCFETVH